jgi:membrane carboxypeptidase/penicillin-binding protein
VKAGGGHVPIRADSRFLRQPPTESLGLGHGEIREVAMTAAFVNFLNAGAEVSGALTGREEASA